MALLFNSDSPAPSPKIYTTLGSLPLFIDPAQPPRRRQPFRALDGVGFVKGVEVVLPGEMFRAVSGEGDEQQSTRRGKYAQVVMKLGEWLEGEVLEGVKKGNVLALSNGRPGVDNTFSIKQGILHFDLDKEACERAGLQGKPTLSGGRKHIKSRYVVEIDLKQPSMRHGKKGFERVRWTAKNVLNIPVNWLVYDGESFEDDEKAHGLSLLAKHNPIITTLEADIGPCTAVRVPPLKPPDLSNDTHGIDISEWTQETVEWLGLVGLGSPRVRPNDNIDPVLSRWALPEGTPKEPQQVRVLRWNGLMDGAWVRMLMVEYIKASKSKALSHIAPENLWVAITVQAHPTASTTTYDGFSIILTGASAASTISIPKTPQKQVSDQPEGKNAQQPHWVTQDKDANEKGKKRRRDSDVNTKENEPAKEKVKGLSDFALFEFVDTVVPY